MNADGSGQTRLTFTSGWGAGYATFSPDGTRIAYAAPTSGDTDFQIFVMNVDGSNKTQLTNNPGNNAYPSWSPDGKRIAYSYENQILYVNKKLSDPIICDIFVMNTDGSEQTKLTDTSKTYPREQCNSPAWSPDGTYISFVCGDIGSQFGTIHIMNVSGTGQLNLDTYVTTMNNGPAVWQP